MQAFHRNDAHADDSRRAPLSFGASVLFLVAGTLVLAACGDDGKLLGSDANAGSSGQASGGSNAGSANSAGSGHAGTSTTAGTSGGGSTSAGTSSGGSTSAGVSNGGSTSAGTSSGGSNAGAGGATCGIPEGCTAGGGQGGGGQANSGCVGMTCGASQTCVAYRTVGGAIFPPDAAGECMTGRHVENNRCQPDFAYTCAELTGCSAPATTCHCAPSTQCANDGVCRLPTAAAWLDPSADLVCEQQAP